MGLPTPEERWQKRRLNYNIHTNWWMKYVKYKRSTYSEKKKGSRIFPGTQEYLAKENTWITQNYSFPRKSRDTLNGKKKKKKMWHGAVIVQNFKLDKSR